MAHLCIPGFFVSGVCLVADVQFVFQDGEGYNEDVSERRNGTDKEVKAQIEPAFCVTCLPLHPLSCTSCMMPIGVAYEPDSMS